MLRSFFYAGWLSLLTLISRPKATALPENQNRFYIVRDGIVVYGLPLNAAAVYELAPKMESCPISCFRVQIAITWLGSGTQQLSAAISEIGKLFDELKRLKHPDAVAANVIIEVGEAEFSGVQFGTANFLAIHDAVVVTLPIYARSVVWKKKIQEVLHGETPS